MKRILTIIGLILLSVVVFLPIYIQCFDGPKYPLENIDTRRLQRGNVELGKKIVSNLCVSCHLSTNGKLGGRVLMDHPDWGYITTSNLSQHPNSHISKYTDQDLFYLLKTGIKPNGNMALPMMPKFATMSDYDINSLIAFLRSNDTLLSPVPNYYSSSRPGFILKVLMKFMIKPVPLNTQAILAPVEKDTLEFGNYLINGRYACYECHSKATETINYINPIATPGYLGGGSRLNIYGNAMGIKSANITPHYETGIGTWGIEDFSKAIQQGIRPDGKHLRAPMNKMTLDSAEIQAIWKYLEKVNPIEHDVKYEDRIVIDQ